MWTFRIRTGAIEGNGVRIGKGHSGFGDAMNDPSRVKERAIGPIPPGKYRIGPAYKHPKLGPLTMNLDPLPGTEMHDRSAMRIHGRNRTPDPSDDSLGCIIADEPIRRAINNSRDRILEVVAD